MSASTSQLEKERIPNHIAIIMDGNGRWAKEKGKDRIFGHYEGVISVRNAVEACAEVGVNYLTLYAFSTENWNRPKAEVNALMELLVSTLDSEIQSLHKNGIRLHVIGDFESLPPNCKKQLSSAIELTANNTGLNVVLALSYSAKWEIAEATKAIARDVQVGKLNVEDINDETISNYLNTAHLPDPELMIRTSGECRISNFLLYQLAYAELYFTPVHWPDFRKEHLFEAIKNYQQRERRFGKTSEQIIQNEA
jgi:undecaprenyl diphosphate synthase